MVVKTNDGRSIDIEGATMKKALQYLPTAGLPELVTWLKKLQVQV
jgi:kynurenine/2-aminoadipate aminotransferase